MGLLDHRTGLVSEVTNSADQLPALYLDCDHERLPKHSPSAFVSCIHHSILSNFKFMPRIVN